MFWILTGLLACNTNPTPIDSDSGEIVGFDTAAWGPPTVGVDVLVIGSGPAGLTAAWEAHKLGASVLVLERDEKAGGGAFFASNLMAVDTIYQQELGIVDSPEIAAEEWPEFTGGGDASDPWVQRLLHESSEVLYWLTEELGGEVLSVEPDLGAGITTRMHSISMDDKHPFHKVVTELADSTWLHHEAGGLMVANGVVLGAAYEDLQTGETGWIQAKETIVATGGYARNDEALFEDRPEAKELLVLYETHHFSIGGGLDLLKDAAAKTQNSGAYGLYVHAMQDWREGMEREALWMPHIRQSLIVDLDGNRVANEIESQGFKLQHKLLSSPQKRLVAIFPEKVWVPQPLIVPGYNLSGPEEKNILSTREALDNGAAFEHFSVTELAEHWSMNADTLQATLDVYEEAAASGVDSAFGKIAYDLVSFQNGALFSVELKLGAAKAFGGAELDEIGRVLDENGEVISGLWAAGEAAGMLGTPAVGWGFSGSVTACYLTGRVAGQNAASKALAD